MLSLKLALLFCVLILGLNGCRQDYEREYKQAVRLVAKDDFDSLNEAIARYDASLRYSILALNGKFEALKALGITLLEHGMYLKAASAFERAKSILPSDSNLHYYLGLAYANAARLGSGDVEKARLVGKAQNAYDLAIQIDPNNTIAHYALGVLLGFVGGDLEGGIASLRTALEQEPNSVEALFAIANLHYQSGEGREAEVYYRRLLGLVEVGSREREKALENLERVRRGL